MPFNHKALILLAVVVLLGAGCLQTTTQEERAEEPENATPAAERPCPDKTDRFANVNADGTGFTFCFDELSQSGEPVMWEKKGADRVVLYSKEDPDFTHSIARFEIEDADPKQAIENTFMTAENRTVCDVVSGVNQNGLWSEYVIAGGDLETQLLCGEFRDGFFISLFDAPQILFYVTVGQDTFMKTPIWLETLQNVENK